MKAIIIEDEKLIVDDLSEIISQSSSEIKVVKTFKNGLDPIVYLQDNDVDIMFVDINIPLLDGLSLAKTISKFEVKPYIVFITAYEEYAAQAFDIKAFDYVLKPYTRERIESIVKEIEKLNEKQIYESKEEKYNDDDIKSKKNVSNKITIKDKNSIVVVYSDDINYLEANEKFTKVYTSTEEHEINHNIADVYQQLPQEKFYRCHKSYVVNLDKIKSIESSGISSYKVKLIGVEMEVPVARRKIKELKSLLNII